MKFDHDKNNLLFLEFCKDQNDTNFERFYNKNHLWLDIILIKSGIYDDDDRHDIKQDIWIKTRDKCSEYNPELGSVRNWIFKTIAYYTFLGYYRDSQRKNNKTINPDGVEIDGEQISFLENLPADEIDSAQDYDRFYLNYVLRNAIGKLKRQDHQKMILLHYFGNLSYKHIAVLMKEKYSNIRVWNHRANNELNEIMNSMGIRS
jgi:RNA polymerase sigma factor (sigma-70 family)